MACSTTALSRLRSSGTENQGAEPRFPGQFSVRVNIPGTLWLVARLEVQPALRVGLEVAGEPQRGIGRDAAPTPNNLVNPRRRHAENLSQRIAGQTERRKERGQSNLSLPAGAKKWGNLRL
jgi:hypothetical protein